MIASDKCLWIIKQKRHSQSRITPRKQKTCSLGSFKTENPLSDSSSCHHKQFRNKELKKKQIGTQ